MLSSKTPDTKAVASFTSLIFNKDEHEAQEVNVHARVCVCQCILEQDVFHRSLLVCCLEIVIFSNRPPGDFPNLMTIFQLPAYHFYKV